MAGLIERERIRDRFAHAAQTYDDHAEAQRQICVHLADLLARHSDMRFRRLLEIGCGSGGFTRLLKQHCQIDEWILNDLCTDWQEHIGRLFPSGTPTFLAGDAEELTFPGGLDLVASASAVQWMSDLPRLFGRIAHALAPGGIWLFNTFAPDNLPEIRTLTGEGLAYPDADRLRQWLAPYFHIAHEETGRITLTFREPMDVLHHLKFTGVTANASGIWTRGRQARFREAYRKRFPSPDGGVVLTYRPLYFLAIRREEDFYSQKTN